MSTPFDPTAALAYGALVQVAYDMYGADSADLTPPVPAEFPAGYRLVSYLNATDDVEGDCKTRFYGFLALSTAAPAELVVAIRGTDCDMEWIIDAEFWPVHFPPVPGSGRVEDGFYSVYKTLVAVAPGGAPQDFRDAVAAQLAGGATRCVVTGHSLGAAVATLAALDVAVNVAGSNPTLYTFASPKVGDGDFVRLFDQKLPDSVRIFNQPDMVPKVPPLYGEVNTAQEIDSTQFPEIKHSIACYHSLRTYLYVLDRQNPFGLSPTCVQSTPAPPVAPS